MSIPRYLTKSRFKLASECPTKLFYTGKNNVYANQKIDDPFLMALAKGGFQVGELAKCYFPGGIEVVAGRGDYESALSQTDELLLSENVTIFEAAIRYRKFFIRVDVLVKIGNQLELIEVKSKSYREGESQFFGKTGTWIDATWKPYLYDVAFQKHVVLNAFPDHTVSAYLMLADKASFCPTDGLNQKFRVKTGVDDQKYVELAAELTAEEIHPDSWILRKVPVDNACDRIFAGTDMKLPEAKSFAERAEEFADYYERDERIASQITGDCKTCEFQTTPEEEVDGKRSGLKECWSQALGWTNADFEVPTSDLGTRVNINCAKPAENPQRNLPVLQRQIVSPDQSELDEFSIWLFRLYHHSSVDGPGRRSVVQVSGCSIRCQGCFVPQTHERKNGTLVSIASIVSEIVSKRSDHDGVTILGGEPFDQPGPVAELAARLKRLGLHLTVYTGYSLETLIDRKDPRIGYILTHTDLLIDGPFLSQLSQNAGEYRGSRNQSFIANVIIE